MEWLRIGEHKLQIRSPHGDHLTFDKDADLLDRVLRTLCGHSKEADPLEPNAVVDAFVKLLSERGFIVPREQSVEGDWLSALLDFQHRQVFRVKSGYADNTSLPLSIALHGAGWVRDCAAEALTDLLRANLITYEPRESSLWLVCADEEDFVSFRKANQEAVLSGARVAFAYRLGSRLILGPLVVPHESACMECHFHRLRANLTHQEEFNEHQRLIAMRGDSFRSDSAIAASYFRYAILRYVAHVAFGLYNSVEPGVLYSYDALDMQPRRQPILKLPRCPVCGRVQKNEPAYAVRDLA